MIDKKLNQFIKNVNKKFERYFVGYGGRVRKKKYIVNIIFDDRDVIRMPKKDLCKKMQEIVNDLNKTKDDIKARVILVSDINYSNLKEILCDFSHIINVKALTSFVDLILPKEAMETFNKLPEMFKLEEFRRELKKISKREYHRNTYQNWLKCLKKAGFIKLKGKIYYKSPGPYKKELLDKINIF